MFDLNDTITERLIFAMENQTSAFVVDAETGNVLDPEDDATLEADIATGTDEGRYVPVPQWKSADGFRLMEDFYRSVGNPDAHLALRAALTRGRGVFRGFKNALEQFPEVERKWFDFKTQAMVRRIAEWFDEVRVARGYERLGPEPDTDADLIDSDFSMKRMDRDHWAECTGLVSAAIAEAMERFPEAVVEYEFTRMDREIVSGARDEVLIVAAEAAAGAIAGVAAARRFYVADRSFAKLLFIFVEPDRRGLGLGKRLVERLRDLYSKEGTDTLIVDIPFLPDAYGKSLSGFGFESFGTRWIATDAF